MCFSRSFRRIGQSLPSNRFALIIRIILGRQLLVKRHNWVLALFFFQ
jgi:hypothetical protein